VDRLVVRDGIRVRLTDSIETALKWGRNHVVVLREVSKTSNVQRPTPNAQPETIWEERRYSTDYGNPETGFRIGELTPRHFSFNSHL
jgi:excinuclease ABC subunit A